MISLDFLLVSGGRGSSGFLSNFKGGGGLRLISFQFQGWSTGCPFNFEGGIPVGSLSPSKGGLPLLGEMRKTNTP